MVSSVMIVGGVWPVEGVWSPVMIVGGVWPVEGVWSPQ